MQPQKVDILIAEDSEVDQFFIRRALDALENTPRYAFVKDGREALELLETSSNPKLIVTDLNMPRMDGHQLISALKSDETRKKIPVLVLSTSEAPEDIQTSYALNANAYLAKPFSPKAYLKLVQSMVDFWLERVALPA